MIIPLIHAGCQWRFEAREVTELLTARVPDVRLADVHHPVEGCGRVDVFLGSWYWRHLEEKSTHEENSTQPISVLNLGMGEEGEGGRRDGGRGRGGGLAHYVQVR